MKEKGKLCDQWLLAGVVDVGVNVSAFWATSALWSQIGIFLTQLRVVDPSQTGSWRSSRGPLEGFPLLWEFSSPTARDSGWDAHSISRRRFSFRSSEVNPHEYRLGSQWPALDSPYSHSSFPQCLHVEILARLGWAVYGSGCCDVCSGIFPCCIWEQKVQWRTIQMSPSTRELVYTLATAHVSTSSDYLNMRRLEIVVFCLGHPVSWKTGPNPGAGSREFWQSSLLTKLRSGWFQKNGGC